jgi:hypothetical protein
MGMREKDDASIEFGFYTPDYFQTAKISFPRPFLFAISVMKGVLLTNSARIDLPVPALRDKPIQAQGGFSIRFPVVCRLRLSKII